MAVNHVYILRVSNGDISIISVVKDPITGETRTPWKITCEELERLLSENIVRLLGVKCTNTHIDFLIEFVPVPPKKNGQPSQNITNKIRKTLVLVLGDMGGSGRRDEVCEILRNRIPEFKEQYYTAFDPSGMPRWKHLTDGVVHALRREEILLPAAKTPRGVWALSPKGWDLYHKIKANKK